MKIVATQWLLFVSFGVSTAIATKPQSTTPRYSHDNDENFKDSSFKLPLPKTEILRNLTNLEQNANTLVPLGRSYTVKIEKSTTYTTVPIRNAMSSNLTKVIKLRRHPSGTSQKPTIQQREDLKRNKIPSVRPKVKYKSNISKPTGSISKLNITSKSGNKIQRIKDINRTSVKVPIRQNILNSTTSRIKLQGTHKNRPKLKIRPMNKQTDGGINPEIITYSPEFPIGSVPLTASDIITQDAFSEIRPQINTYSPEYSISDSSLYPVNQDFSNGPNTPNRNPISQVILQSAPNSQTGTKDSFENDCPSFLISSNVFGPQRQGCSDLNVVINSHLNQNVITEAVPEIQPLSSQAEAAAADDPVADTPEQLASPAVQSPGADAPAAAPAQPTNGGSQGGGLPQLPGLPELSLPDLKGLFDLLGALWRIISPIFGFLTNPYLYLVPAAISFALGFLKIIGSFKLFVVIPALLLFGYVNRDKPPEVAYYKHIHKPIHHNDGWFWNHNTKTWNNIADYVHSKHPKIIEKG